MEQDRDILDKGATTVGTGLGAFDVVEASIQDMRSALDTGEINSEALVGAYLERIKRYDKSGPSLNAVPILNPEAIKEASLADQRRRRGESLSRLDGIPFTVKDSFKVKGLTVASGSPAFKDLMANDDAFTVARLRDAGAIVLGKTTMAPMAAGGMQRGLYGRAESPYNSEYLAAAWFSGSSNGSGVSTAASFAAFGLAEETLSSGRSPASNNGLVAYTPSRGIISIRGNWPLLALRDVVVPHTRTVIDLLEVLDIIIQDDPETIGDLWRQQSFVALPRPSDIRPQTYLELADKDALDGKRVGVPQIYVGGGGNLPDPITLRPSIAALWERAATVLRDLGAELVPVEVPALLRYEQRGPFAPTPGGALLPDSYINDEGTELLAATWEEFLSVNADPHVDTLEKVDPEHIFPEHMRGLVDEINPLPRHNWRHIVACTRDGRRPPLQIPGLQQAIEGTESLRAELWDGWMREQQLDLLAFPANTDVGRSDADWNPDSVREAWRNGVACSTGNFAIRHLGIPTVTLTMGLAEDIRMPVGVTFAGPAYGDSLLLSTAYAFEQASGQRVPPPMAPTLCDGADWKDSRKGISD